MAFNYGSGQHIVERPVIDHAKRVAHQAGIPTARSARNSETVSRVNHGTAGSLGGGNWAEHRAAYMASTSAQQQREDAGHMESLRQDMRANGVHEHAIQRLDRYLGMRHAFDPGLIAWLRKVGSKQTRGEPMDGERVAARGDEMAAGHQGRAPVPTHPKQDTRGHLQTKANNVLSRFASVLHRGDARLGGQMSPEEYHRVTGKNL